MQHPFDWSRFQLKIYVAAPIHSIFNAWATPGGLESWFLKQADFTKPDGILRDKDELLVAGDMYEWRWFGYPDSLVEHGVVLDVDANKTFSFRFGNAGVVTISFRVVEGMVEVLLTQDQIPTDEKSRADFHVGCSVGWTFYLANLKSIMEGGADLRNKNEALTNVINS